MALTGGPPPSQGAGPRRDPAPSMDLWQDPDAASEGISEAPTYEIGVWGVETASASLWRIGNDCPQFGQHR
jgi:hypothetical protein